MAPDSPPRDSKRRRVEETARSGVRWVKNTLRPSSSSRPHSRSPAPRVDTRSPSPAPSWTSVQEVTTRFASQPATGGTGPGAGPSTTAGASVLVDTNTASASNPGPGTLNKPKETTNAAWGGLEKALQVLERGAGVFPPLKSAISEFRACLDIVEMATSKRDDYQDLASDLTTTVDTLEEYMDELTLEDRSGTVARIASSIKEEVARINEHQRRGKLGRLLESTQSGEDVVRCYRLIEASFRQLQNDVSIRTLRNTSKQFEVTMLQSLSPEEDARYNSAYSITVKRRGCTAETRERVQEGLQDWVQDPDGAKVYWMNGMAGTGKTTIAYSLCEWLEENKLLGASFFCSRTAASCRNVNRIVPTIACQLARYSPAFRSALCKVLEDDTGVAKLNVVQQFEKLVKGPLVEVKPAIPDGVVIVIDALDECEDNHGVRLVLATLMRLAAALPVKFFVASRPEQVIREKMLSSSDYSPFVLRLHDIEESIVGEDIKKYLRESLGPMSPPPSDHQIEQLTKRAGKLFIYAATVVRYIYPDDISVDSDERLRMMLSIDTVSPIEDEDSAGYDELDQLYATILAAALNPRLKRREKENRQLVLRTVVCARGPMTMQTLASLLGLTEQQVSFALQPLQSVLHISTGGGLVSALHASFPDYMFDQSRSGAFTWHCNVIEHSEILAHRCFNTMRENLQFNMCDLESSYVFDEDVPDLEERIKANISPVLFYACRYWGEHLRQAGVSKLLYDQLVDFFSHRLLFWMEVLNLKQCIATGAPILLQAHAWLLANGSPIDTNKNAIDARNFVIRFAASACTRSTPHIYVSALPFCPKSSSVYAHYWRRTNGLINDKGTAKLREHALISIWKSRSAIFAVAFSPDGTRIVSGSQDSTIQVWDMHTGDVVAGPFKGHSDWVNSVAFSPDGTRIVSGSDDRTIRVWDMHTGDVVAGPFEGHSGSVKSVAFSPDGTHIVSGSDDSTIRVWDMHTGDVVAGPFEGHSGSVNSVALSPDGTHIVSGSYDRTIRVWDIHTGDVVAGPFEGHSDSVKSVAFSPDSTRIVSGSHDRTIRVWDMHTGDVVAGPFEGHSDWVKSVSFSPDGTRIVSGSDDMTIRVWDMHTGGIVAGPFEGHSDSVMSVAFSPDGTRIVSGSSDRTIQVWDMHTGDVVAGPFEGHSHSINSVAFSPDRTHIVSGAQDSTIRVWDMHTGNVVAGPFKGHSDPVNSVAFSPDGTRIVSGSHDGTIRVWDMHSGDVVAGPFKGHSDWVNSVAFSPDGTCIVSGSYDRTIRVWDMHTDDVVAGPFEGHSGSVNSVALSPDGTRIVSGSFDSTIRVWDMHTGNVVAGPFEGHSSSVESVAFSPDGTRIVSGSSDNTIRVWDMHTGDVVAGPFKGHSDSVNSVAFSPDGTRIVSGSQDSTIRVWDMHTGDIVAGPFEGHSDWVKSVAFSPDGTRIVSGSHDRTIRVWDMHPGNLTGSIEGHSWDFNDNGWITSNNVPLFWVSPELHRYLPRPPHELVIGPQGSISVKTWDLLLGKDWSKCFTPPG